LLRKAFQHLKTLHAPTCALGIRLGKRLVIPATPARSAIYRSAMRRLVALAILAATASLTLTTPALASTGPPTIKLPVGCHVTKPTVAEAPDPVVPELVYTVTSHPLTCSAASGYRVVSGLTLYQLWTPGVGWTIAWPQYASSSAPAPGVISTAAPVTPSETYWLPNWRGEARYLVQSTATGGQAYVRIFTPAEPW
jgi:hypothetical protein